MLASRHYVRMGAVLLTICGASCAAVPACLAASTLGKTRQERSPFQNMDNIFRAVIAVLKAAIRPMRRVSSRVLARGTRVPRWPFLNLSRHFRLMAKDVRTPLSRSILALE